MSNQEILESIRGKLIVSCFDAVTNDIVVNTKCEFPATLAQIEL